ncbi:hypothetical protein GPECTOR_43g862 [Gonium pectorale]|uniref:Fucosyltransferase n=1 Tax=Gonium pectorale TaxID=33097 RepID=A0A150G9A2_GONPE|nr:hypothetical protein GPECTOR_43g862 [Gonium pectorale]|eukprot:KXZ46426.1 hypothetical protein GPECTOR_43g862 [Gonium pectorale]
MLSVESGLADRLGCSLTAFLYALLTDRVFEYVWYGHHVLWESYQSPWIDWRAPPRDVSRGVTVPAPPGAPGPVLPIVLENHHWSRPNRTTLNADFYINPPNEAVKAWVQNLFNSGDVMEYGRDHDVVQWMLNLGLLRFAFNNPHLQKRLQELGLTWQNVVPCLFNYLYVPSPEALSIFRRTPLLHTLLDPNNIVIGIQIRLGDWVFNQPANAAQGVMHLQYGNWHFHCAQQLTDELIASGAAHIPGAPLQLQRRASFLSLRGVSRRNAADAGGGSGAAGGRRKVYWLLISDSGALRAAALQKYNDGRLLVADDFPRNRQTGLHVAATEMWLFGLASMHVVSTGSAFGRLGALAGGPKSLDGQEAARYRIYGVTNRLKHCRLAGPDPTEAVASCGRAATGAETEAVKGAP